MTRALREERFYLNEEEIARKMRMTTAQWRAAAAALEKYGLPRKDALFQDMRCWPAVEEFLKKRASSVAAGSSAGEAHGYKGFRRKTARAEDPAQQVGSDSAVLVRLPTRG